MVYGIRFGGIYRKEEEEDEDEDQRRHPSMLQGVPLPLLEERFSLPPFREGLLAVLVCLRLLVVNKISRVCGSGVECEPSVCPGTAASRST